MRIASDPQPKEIVQGFVAAGGGDPAGRNKPPQHMCHFDIQ